MLITIIMKRITKKCGETMMINALDIWEKLAKSKWCQDAVCFYRSKHVSRDAVLDHGSADFDCLVTDDPNEKPYYRAATYIAKHYEDSRYDGYMNMHIHQNRASTRKYLMDLNTGHRILFVDFGCGPMTAGLVFAQLMSSKSEKHKIDSHYMGIDASRSMCAIALAINTKFGVFKDENFDIFHRTDLDLNPCMPQFQTILLSVSFVLSGNTLRTNGVDFPIKLAEQWHRFVKTQSKCQDLRIIYHNPTGDFHQNWFSFCKRMKDLSKQTTMSLEYSGLDECNWYKDRVSQMAQVRGTREETV